MKTGYLIAGLVAGAFAYEFNRTADIESAFAGYVTDLQAAPSTNCVYETDCDMQDITATLENQIQERMSVDITLDGHNLEIGDIMAVYYTQTAIGYVLDNIGLEAERNIQAIEIIPLP